MLKQVLFVMAMAVSVLSCQRQDHSAPDWQETADFVSRTLEHYGKYPVFGEPDYGDITGVTTTPDSLTFQFREPYRNPGSNVQFAQLIRVSIPLGALYVDSFKVVKSDWSSEERPLYNLNFYCLRGNGIRATVTRDPSDQNSDGSLVKTEDDNQWGINTLGDEETADQLARALKHLAILAGSPKGGLFNK